MSDDQTPQDAGAPPPPQPNFVTPPPNYTPPPPPEQAPPPPPQEQAPPPPPPPPTTVTYAPAPPPQPPVATATAVAAPPPPPKKSKKTLWIVLAIVGVLLLCCCAVVAGIALWGGNSAVKTQEALDTTNKHFEAAKSALDPASEAITGLTAYSSTTEVQNVISENEPKLTSAESELKAAKTAIVALPANDPIRVDYLKAIEEQSKRPKLLRELLDTLSGASAFSEALNSGRDLYSKGNANLEKATKWLNKGVKSRKKGDYTQAMTYGLRAASQFKQSESALRKAHQMNPAAGVDQMFAFVNLQQRKAVLSHDLARYGRAGNFANYNRTVKLYNATLKKLGKMREPELLSGSYYESLLSDVKGQLDTAVSRSDEYFQKANALAKQGSGGTTP